MRSRVRCNSVQQRLKDGLARLGYSSFDDYLFDRASRTLKGMAEELGIPSASFAVEHRRHLTKMAEKSGMALCP